MLITILLELIIIYILIKLIQCYKKEIHQKECMINKLKQSYGLTIDWINLYQKKKSITNYLIKKGYSSVIIYGLSDVGYKLYEEIKESSINIVCILDQSIVGALEEIEIRKPNHAIPSADIVIVASTFFLLEIEQVLKGKVNCPIVALDDLLAEINEQC